MDENIMLKSRNNKKYSVQKRPYMHQVLKALVKS